ncbi:hypothetical protein OPV22_029760 [Ensete ventricosum]|uniref:Uncharacterized protein n=1 Tax=Ensete ventricosum TaxID=4639 RepID=A0AAV8QC37_ENSVE|nr:hypothetical protein OPV22_029760 [Ensete ventricosum]
MAVNDAASSAAEWSLFDGRSVERTPSLAPAVFGLASESIVVTAASNQTSGGGGTARPGSAGVIWFLMHWEEFTQLLLIDVFARGVMASTGRG